MVRAYALSTALAFAASVSGLVVPRKTPPSSWVTPIMEDYDAYNARYIALSCQTQHGTQFFDDCCHPMKVNETLATARPAKCDPANATPSASTAPAPAQSGVANISGDAPDEGCDDEEDNSGGLSGALGGSDNEPAAPQSPPAPKSSSTPQPPAPPASKPTPASKPSPAADAPTPSSKAPAPSSKPEGEPKPSPAQKPSSAKPEPTSPAGSSSGGSLGDLITGGFATFYNQEGGIGSCGDKHSDSDFIVAVQQERMNSSLCGKKVKITNPANSKSVDAIVADTCPGCKNSNSLDLSIATFNAIADPALGIVPIVWQFIDN